MPSLKKIISQQADFYSAPGGRIYYLDPTHGLAGNYGDSATKACSSLATLQAKLRDGYNDIIYFIPGATAYYPSAAVTWSNSYNKLIGIGHTLPRGLGSRQRIVNNTTNDLTAGWFTVSGSANTFENIQWFDGKDADADAGAVLVSGSRNHFKNCFFAGMGHATPAARAGSYSLKVTGSENFFEGCTIGLDTILRTAASHELIITGSRNYFLDCDIVTYSETAGTFLAQIDNTGGDMHHQIFENCRFICYTANNATGITNVFDMPTAGGSTAYVYLDKCAAFGGGAAGIGAAWSDVDTSIFVSMPIPNTAGGKALAAT